MRDLDEVVYNGTPTCVSTDGMIACGCALSRRGYLVSLRQEPGGLILERHGDR